MLLVVLSKFQLQYQEFLFDLMLIFLVVFFLFYFLDLQLLNLIHLSILHYLNLMIHLRLYLMHLLKIDHYL